jgi:hypothetical protein
MRVGIVLLVRISNVPAPYDRGPGVERYRRQRQRSRLSPQAERPLSKPRRIAAMPWAGADRRYSIIGLQEFDQALCKRLMMQPPPQSQAELGCVGRSRLFSCRKDSIPSSIAIENTALAHARSRRLREP